MRGKRPHGLPYGGYGVREDVFSTVVRSGFPDASTERSSSRSGADVHQAGPASLYCCKIGEKVYSYFRYIVQFQDRPALFKSTDLGSNLAKGGIFCVAFVVSLLL